MSTMVEQSLILFSVNVVLEIWLLKRKEIDMEIKNVGQLRKLLKIFPMITKSKCELGANCLTKN